MQTRDEFILKMLFGAAFKVHFKSAVPLFTDPQRLLRTAEAH